jgi:hypothetical protein
MTSDIKGLIERLRGQKTGFPHHRALYDEAADALEALTATLKPQGVEARDADRSQPAGAVCGHCGEALWSDDDHADGCSSQAVADAPSQTERPAYTSPGPLYDQPSQTSGEDVERAARIIDPTAFELLDECSRVAALPDTDRAPEPLLDEATRAANERCAIAADKAARILAALSTQPSPTLCEDCPPDGYPTDKTRCDPCPRRPSPTQALGDEAGALEKADPARRDGDSLESIVREVRGYAMIGGAPDLSERDALLFLTDKATYLYERLQAVIDWADLALSMPQEFDGHGVRNLDGPVFDEARRALSALAAPKGEEERGLSPSVAESAAIPQEAHPADAEPSGWRDISTARKKHGETVLLVADGRVIAAEWGTTDYDRSAKRYNQGWTTGPSSPVRGVVTLWQPLPEPPASEMAALEAVQLGNSGTNKALQQGGSE